MKKHLMATLIVMATSSTVLAKTYTVEVVASASDMEFDGGNGITMLGMGGTMYFSSVDTTGHALGEAAFLNRSSNLSAAYVAVNSDYQDMSGVQVEAEFYIPNSIFFVGANYLKMKGDEFSENVWGARVGVAPIEGLLITSSYLDDENYEPNIAVKYVTPLSGDRTLNIYGDIARLEDSTLYTAGMDYYFMRNASVGFEYSDALSDDAAFNDFFQEYTFKGEYFFNEKASLGVFYTEDDSGRSLGVDVGFRF